MLTRQQMIQDFLEFFPDNSNVLLPEIGNWDCKSMGHSTASHSILLKTAFSQTHCQDIDMHQELTITHRGVHPICFEPWFGLVHHHLDTVHQMVYFTISGQNSWHAEMDFRDKLLQKCSSFFINYRKSWK